MTKKFNIPLEQFEVARMLDDRSVRVDFKHISRGENIHYAPFYRVYRPDNEVYEELLEATGIKNPGDTFRADYDLPKP